MKTDMQSRAARPPAVREPRRAQAPPTPPPRKLGEPAGRPPVGAFAGRSTMGQPPGKVPFRLALERADD